MKITTVLILATALHVSATGHSQRVTLSEKNASLERVFRSIHRQTGFQFVYNDETMRGAKPVSIEVSNAPLEDVLALCFKGQPLDYTMQNNAIVVKHKPTAVVAVINNAGEEKEPIPTIDITARVTDSLGRPMEGASILVRGTRTGTTTNALGLFTLRGVAPDAIIVISYAGYHDVVLVASAVVASSDQQQRDKIFTIVMRIDTKQGSEIIINTGYETKKINEVTGSVTYIDNELLNRRISSDLLSRLYDVSSGLVYDRRNINNPTKSPITIRGISTINGNPNPLIVVDGFAYDESFNPNFLLANNLNPNDVESITILKDAAAASIWGTRAGNGVIVITTKRGKFNQRLKVQANSNITIASKPDLYYPQVMSPTDLVGVQAKLFQLGIYNAYNDFYPSIELFPVLPQVAEILLSFRKGTISQSQADQQIAELAKNDNRKDIGNYFLQASKTYQHSLNISGGSERASYYASVGYDKSIPNSVGQSSERISFRSDNTFRPFKKLEVSAYTVYTKGKSIANDVSSTAFANMPIYTSLVGSQGNSIAIPWKYRTAYVDTAKVPDLLDWRYRPLEELNLNKTTASNVDIRVGGAIKYEFFKGLSVESKFQYQKVISRIDIFHDEQSFFTRDLINQYKFRTVTGGVNRDTLPIPRGGILDFSNGQKGTWNVRNQLNFSRSFGSHDVSAIAGFEFSEANSDFYTNRWYGFDPQTNTFTKLINYDRNYKLRASSGSSARIPNVDGFSGGINRLRSYYLNSLYTYSKLYTISFSARQDGANLFGVKANKKRAPLWSAGFVWNLANEKFYKVPWMNRGALRISYGYNGNTKADATTYATIEFLNDFTTGALAASFLTSPNPALSWERVQILNLGFDFGFFDNRITGSVDYYRKKGIDLIGTIINDPTTGRDRYTGNIASIKGRGVDVSINTINIKGKISWQTNFLFNYNTDKVVAYLEAPNVTSLLNSGPNLGKPLYGIYSYRWGGLNPANGDPMGYVADTVASFTTVLGSTSGVPNTKPGDLIYNGSASPTFFGSIRNTFSWRGFSISCNVSYKLGYYFRRNSIFYNNLYSGLNGHGDYANRWVKPGDEQTTNVPSFPITNNTARDQFYQMSDILVEKGDHIRLQDIRVEHQFRDGLFKLKTLQNFSIYMYASNLGILWNANEKGIDPDFNNSIPLSKNYAMGVRFTF